jgi:hypothetical protein
MFHLLEVNSPKGENAKQFDFDYSILVRVLEQSFAD